MECRPTDFRQHHRASAQRLDGGARPAPRLRVYRRAYRRGLLQSAHRKEDYSLVQDSELNHLEVEGNLMMIMFPMENDSTYNKFAYIESTNMDAYFKNNTSTMV